MSPAPAPFGTPPAEANTPALASRPDPAASPDAAPQGAPEAGGLASEIHAALDRLTAAPISGRPIGAGDWSAALKAIAAVYAERDYAPLWLADDRFGERAKAVQSRLARANEDGLDLRATPPPSFDLIAGATAPLADADVALSAAVVAYAMQASGARVKPRSLSTEVTADPEIADPSFALKRVAARRRPRRRARRFQSAAVRLSRSCALRWRGCADRRRAPSRICRRVLN